MKRLRVIAAVGAPLLRDDVDTDIMIPVPFLRSATGMLGKHLFENLRYTTEGEEDPEFVLNRPAFREARILLGRRNFGCGSSREQAVWALQDFGIEVVIAESFADIFRSNAERLGLLCAVVSPPDLNALGVLDQDFERAPTLTVDLQEQVVRRGTACVRFTTDALARHALLGGIDLVDVALGYLVPIDEYQALDRVRRPWIHDAGIALGAIPPGSRR